MSHLSQSWSPVVGSNRIRSGRPIEVESLVRLKSGGQVMLVLATGEDGLPSSAWARCVYLKGVLCESVKIALADLIIVEPNYFPA